MGRPPDPPLSEREKEIIREVVWSLWKVQSSARLMNLLVQLHKVSRILDPKGLKTPEEAGETTSKGGSEITFFFLSFRSW